MVEIMIREIGDMTRLDSTTAIVVFIPILCYHGEYILLFFLTMSMAINFILIHFDVG